MNQDLPEDKIRKLAKILKEEGLTEIELESDGLKIKVCKDEVVSLAPKQAQASAPVASAVAASPVVVPDSNLVDVKSPMVGTFYVSSSPDSEPFVKVGSRVNSGDVLCVIEAMKLFNELPAELSGELVEICVNNAQTVSFGDVLMRIRKS